MVAELLFCFDAQDPSVAMSVEQAHQRLEIAEGVIHELQKQQQQRGSAGHQAVHQELSALRSQPRYAVTCPAGGFEDSSPTGSERRMARVGELGRTWQETPSVGVVHATLKLAMKAAENQKQPISVTHFQHDSM